MPLFSPSAANAAAFVVPLTSIYASLQSHKSDFNFEVFNLVRLSVLYVPCNLAFISTQNFVLNLLS